MMNKIFENWNRYLNENVYSNELHDFIQFSYELDELVEEEKISYYSKMKRLSDFLQNNHFKIIGSGLSRHGWKSPTGEIIKMATSLEGAYSNEEEIEKFNRQDIEAFPRIEAYDKKNYMWFVVEPVTQIGKEDTWNKYKKLFPKLFGLAEKIHELMDYDISYSPEPHWRAVDVLKDLLQFKFSLKNPPDWGGADLDHSVLRIFKINYPQTEQEQKLHKFAVESTLKYLKNPDPNFAKILRAVIDAHIYPDDFHYNNLGYDENWNIKIMDAG